MPFATALERHFDWRFWLPAYTFASYVAISRLHDNVAAQTSGDFQRLHPLGLTRNAPNNS
jgi:hypothetical protein